MKILLVDDSRSASAVFAMRLETMGHSVSVAENGLVAVERFRELAPDLVLMDIEMPVMDGFEATHRIREFEASGQWAWTPIIFLTAVGTPENFVTSVDAGGDDLIPKNVPEPVLRAKLKAMARVAALRHGLIDANRRMQDDIRARQQAEDELSRRCAELTELNDRLSRMQLQLLQAEKLASVGQLAAGVAHEINTPIGFVQSNLGTLATYLARLDEALQAYAAQASTLPPSAASQLADVRRRLDLDFIGEDAPMLIRESRAGIERVSRIVRSLKDFSQLDRMRAWTQVDLHPVIENAVALIAGDVQSKARIVREFGALPEVECQPEQLGEVVVALLTNAAQAIDEVPGTITLRTGADEDGVWLDVIDDGCGMPPAVRARVFDPFFTTRPVGKGAGLGLSLAYGIVQQHAGTIEVDSEVGRGSRFRVRLPVRQPDASAAGR
jgi:signal transduction histidine kinase